MNKKNILALSVVLFGFWAVSLPVNVSQAVEVKVDDDKKIDLGFTLQTYALRTDRDVNEDGLDFESVNDFLVRRAGIRAGADVTDSVSLFLQTDIEQDRDNRSSGMNLIDAYITMKPHDWFKMMMGRYLPPVTRENISSSVKLLAFERPAITYKTLSWGTRAPAAFTTTNVIDTDAGLRAKASSRDTGLTFFGSGPIGQGGISVKYYTGIFDGVQNAELNNLRYASRIQINIGDPEPDYIHSANYLGAKKTISIGLAYDAQRNAANDGSRNVDYGLYAGDVFLELPAGAGSLTAEGGYIKMNLDHSGQLVSDSATGSQSQGDGYYVQAGYLIGKKWQPWAEWETWKSDDPAGIGSFDLYRIGLSYFLKGHNANIKLAYESMNADHNFTDVVTEDSIKSYILGFFLSF